MIKAEFNPSRLWAICATAALVTEASAQDVADVARKHVGTAVAAPAISSGQKPVAAVTERDLVRFGAEIEKLKVESEKLKEEQENLKMNNEALSRRSRTLIAWLSPLSSVVGVLIGALLGFFFNRNYSKAQGQKLEQERHIEREKHMMALFENLGSESAAVQLAAAAMLVQRLDGLKEKHPTGPTEKLECRTIIQVLVSITKKAPMASDEVASVAPVNLAVCKFISDKISSSFAVPEATVRNFSDQHSSEMASFDFQGVQLKNSHWATSDKNNRIDASGADFFEADLSESSLKNVIFWKSVFMRADLTKAKLQDSDLRGAVLKEALLIGAQLQRTNLIGADLSGATLTNANFDGAKVYGATIKDCKFSDIANAVVDISERGDGTAKISVREWLVVPTA